MRPTLSRRRIITPAQVQRTETITTSILPKSSIEIFDDCEQGSEDWMKLRCGMLTASNFAHAMASRKDGQESKTRTKLLYQIAGEIITGIPAENYSNGYMDRGKVMEAEIRDQYAETTFEEVRQVAFVRNGKIGCSPDAMIGTDGVLEIKSMAPHLMIEHMVRGAGLPPEHRAQVQGCLLVTERAFCDVRIGYTGMPPLKFRAERDEAYLRELRDAIDLFHYDLKRVVEMVRNRA